MYKIFLLLILLLTGFSSWAQPIPPLTAYTFLFGTNRTAAEARAYLGIDIIAGGASNAVVNVNGMTNAQQRFQITTNATTTGLPTVTTNGAGAIGTNFFNHPFAGPAVSGILHSNDFQRFTTVTPDTNFGPRMHIVTNNNWIDFTNKSQLAAAGDWVVIPPAPSGVIHVHTNLVSLLRPGVNYEVYPLLVIGSALDLTVNRPAFNETAATSNTLIFHNGLIVSNHGSHVFAFTNAASQINISGKFLHRAGTNLNSATLLVAGGTSHIKVGKIQNDGYDGLWVANGAATNYTEADEWLAADQCVELVAITGRVVVKGKFAKRHYTSTAKPNKDAVIFTSGGHLTLDFDEVYCYTNGLVYAGADLTIGRDMVRIKKLWCDERNLGSILSVGFESYFSGLVIGPSNGVPVAVNGFQDYPLTLENTTIIAGINTTQSIVSDDPTQIYPLHVIGSLNINQPLGTGIIVHGNLVSTNTAITAPSVSLTADNQTISVTNRKYIKLSSDNGTAGNRTFLLSQGIAGQELDIEWIGANAGEIADDSAVTGGGNARLNGTWTPVQYDHLLLKFNGVDWGEVSRGLIAAGGEVTSSGASVDNNLPRASGTSGDAIDWTLVNVNDTNGVSIPGGVAAHEVKATNGITAATLRASGSGGGYIILDGSTTGSQQFMSTASGQTNVFVFNIVNMSANQVLAAHSITAAGPTNVIVVTNITVAGGAVIENEVVGSAWNGDTANGAAKDNLHDWLVVFDPDYDGKVSVLDQGVGIAITDSGGVLQTPVTASAGLAAALGDETGSGASVFANGPALGTFGSSTNANLNFVYITNNNAFALTTQLVATNSTVNSNLTMNVNLGVQDLFITNNISVTNFSNLEAGQSKTVTWHLYPTLVNRTVVWPTLGAPGHAVYWRTNANSPMWTTLTNGSMYVLSLEWRNTNAWASISEWK